jgi:PPOX class probable F420-dependent enzyme
MTIPIPNDVRQLLDAPNYVHLSTLRADGSPRNWVVWVGLEDDHILVCTSDAIWKAKDMRRHPRVAMSVTDMANPYHMAAIQGRVVEVRPDEDCRYMDPISFKYTNKPFPGRGPDRVCFVIAIENAAGGHSPSSTIRPSKGHWVRGGLDEPARPPRAGSRPDRAFAACRRSSPEVDVRDIHEADQGPANAAAGAA